MDDIIYKIKLAEDTEYDVFEDHCCRPYIGVASLWLSKRHPELKSATVHIKGILEDIVIYIDKVEDRNSRVISPENYN